jgi:hypothetical protein
MDMSEQALLLKFHQLPANLQKEVLDFIAFLLQQQENKVSGEKRAARKAGTMKGLITYMAEDFNAPIEDFKDYM